MPRRQGRHGLEEAQTQTRSEDDWLKSEAQRQKEREQEENRDPWAYAPYFKTQQLEEDLGTAVCVAMTSDGKRFFSSAGPAIRGWVQAKKVEGRPQGPAISLRVDHAGAHEGRDLSQNCS